MDSDAKKQGKRHPAAQPELDAVEAIARSRGWFPLAVGESCVVSYSAPLEQGLRRYSISRVDNACEYCLAQGKVLFSYSEKGGPVYTPCPVCQKDVLPESNCTAARMMEAQLNQLFVSALSAEVIQLITRLWQQQYPHRKKFVVFHDHDDGWLVQYAHDYFVVAAKGNEITFQIYL